MQETLAFVDREMTSAEGLFFSAIDADSEGEEGKYYVWKSEELKAILGSDFELFGRVFNVNERGFWEHDNNILLRSQRDESAAESEGLSISEFIKTIDRCKKSLLDARSKRMRPLVDEKVLVSWNGLMIKGYADAYRALGDEAYLQTALRAAHVLLEKTRQADGSLWRVYNRGNAFVDAFLDDYACLTDAFFTLYACTFDASWLKLAKALCDYTLANFSQEEHSGLFYYTSNRHPEVVLRQAEAQDNVIPSSNSILAKNLVQLYLHFFEDNYRNQAERMLAAVRDQVLEATPWYYNWAILACQLTADFYEVALVGNEAKRLASDFRAHYLPNTLIAVADTLEATDLPMLNGRWQEGKTLIYVCRNQACQMPVETVEDALRLMRNQTDL